MKAQDHFLLNFSNHPFETWLPNQQQLAIERYRQVKDMNFPSIPPEANEEEIGKLVLKFYQEIANMKPQAVHIMGEMTFTYRLVEKLKESGMPCIASTSKRKVEMEKDGTKRVKFEFVTFRKY